MISSFEVGAVFKILDEASPAIRKILTQIRELNKAVETARANLASLGRSTLPALTGSVGETQALAKAWQEVAEASALATRSIGRAAVAARGAALPPAGGGGRHQPGFIARAGGAGVHLGGPSLPLPGGAHARFRGAGAAGLGLAAYGAYEAARMEDVVWQMIYHSGQADTADNRSKFRKILQDSMAESGYSLHDTGKAALQEIRMFQGTPGHGIDVLPEMMRAAWIEARAKDSSLEESMKSFIGLAHMTKQYDPEQIKKLAPAFAYLSTSNPSSLSGIERAAGYAVPILQSGLDIDPIQSLLLGTALTRAGATSTKSGTWLREMAVRAMPGTAIFESTKKAERHDDLLRRIGLLDDKGNATWMSNGRPDLLKLLEIAGPALEKIPVSERAGVERKLFGAQGSGAISLLADPAVREQVTALRKEMDSPEFRNRYASFAQAYQEGSTVQNARTAVAEFNNTMMDLGARTLPAVNKTLGDFKEILRGIRDVIPGTNSGGASIGSRALEGAALGAAGGLAVGAFGGPIGMAGGAVLGGVAGAAHGFMEEYTREKRKAQEELEKTATEAQRAKQQDVKQSLAAGAMPPISFSLNLDGTTLARAIIDKLHALSIFPTGAPAADGLGQPYAGDHNYPDK